MAKQQKQKSDETPQKVSVNDEVSKSAATTQQNAPAPDPKAEPAKVYQISETKRRIDS